MSRHFRKSGQSELPLDCLIAREIRQVLRRGDKQHDKIVAFCRFAEDFQLHPF